MKNFKEIQRQLWQEQLDKLLEEYSAAMNQGSNELGEVNRTRLSRKSMQLEAEIKALEQKLGIVSDKGITEDPTEKLFKVGADQYFDDLVNRLADVETPEQLRDLFDGLIIPLSDRGRIIDKYVAGA